jgi:phage tail sheath gpL-like
MTYLRIDAESPLTAAQLVAAVDAAPLGFAGSANMINYLQAVIGGEAQAELKLAVGSVKAAGAVVFTGLPTAAETVTIANVVFTARASGATGNEFNIGASATATATNLKNAINASSSLTGIVVATSSVGTVTLTAAVSGKNGNAIQLSEALTNATVTQFTGGTNGTLYTLNLK